LQEFDFLVIGAGPAGYVGAIRAAQLGARVCLVEKAEVGGVCLNRGCIPTKTLTSFAALYERAKTAGEFGVRIDGTITADLAFAVQRKRRVVSTLVQGVRSLLAKRGVTLVAGEAGFVGERTVEVASPAGTEKLGAKNILIATGSETAELTGIPFDGVRVISSTEALELEEVPKSVLVIGAGAIGCEFAFILSALGSAVTVIEILDRALPFEDTDVSSVMEREFKKRKVNLITRDSVSSCLHNPSGVKCALKSGKEIEAAMVLVSVGRRFNTGGLGLDKAGVRCGGKGEVETNEYMETSVPGIYAAGDVAGKKMYAHSASREAIVAAENALEVERKDGVRTQMDYSAVPACTFTTPEVGTVGMTEAQALERGLSVRVGKFNFRGLGRAQVLGEVVGMVKIVAHAETDVVLGVHIIGAHATELVHEGAIAVAHGLTARALAETIHAHPTLSEAIMEAAGGVHGISIHSSL